MLLTLAIVELQRELEAAAECDALRGGDLPEPPTHATPPHVLRPVGGPGFGLGEIPERQVAVRPSLPGEARGGKINRGAAR